MKLIRGLHNYSPALRGCVATVGNFDGVHRGHQAVLSRLKSMAEQHQAKTLVMVFEPQPKEFFQGNQAPSRLQTLAEKAKSLAEQQIDQVLVVPFNERFRSLTGDQFVETVLVELLGIQGLIVGDDFKFGCDRSGDFRLLQRASDKHGFELLDTKTIKHDAERVSSTAIRECLELGQFEQAHQMLGRPFSIEGKVAHGQKLGRTIGFPTANVLLKRKVPPLTGVFAVSLMLGKSENTKSLYGVANLGFRPTVGGVKPVFEVHLFDFSGDLYGKKVKVEFLEKIRDEKKFSGLDELKQAIAQDTAKAKQILFD